MEKKGDSKESHRYLSKCELKQKVYPHSLFWLYTARMKHKSVQQSEFASLKLNNNKKKKIKLKIKIKPESNGETE